MFILIKNLIRNKVSFILFILCICFIFYNSSLPAIESSEVSEGLTYKLYELLNLKLDFLTFHIFIRKLAHFTEYFGLGLFAFYAFKDYKISLLLSVLVACCDEILQLFVVGRSGQISDVLLDSLGVFVSIFSNNTLFTLIVKRRYKE